MTNVNISRHHDTLLNTTIRNSGDRPRVIQKINDVINYRPTIAILKQPDLYPLGLPTQRRGGCRT